MIRRLARWVLSWSPELHIVVIVGLFVSLAANLLVTSYTYEHRKLSTFFAMLLALLATVSYLPVASEANHLWQDARRRGGMAPREIVLQLMELGSEKSVLLKVGCCFCVALGSLLGLIVLLFSQEFNPVVLRQDPRLFTQIVANGIVAGSLYALVAVGFGLIYSTCRFFHFAHGAMLTVGAYSAFSFIKLCGLRPFAGILGAILLTSLLGGVTELSIYRPLRRIGGTPVILLIVALGIFIGIQSFVSLLFGDDTRLLRSTPTTEGISVLGARISTIQIIIVLVSVFLALGISGGLLFTKLGRMVRAVANDSELAWTFGIRRDMVVLLVFIIGSALAGIAGVLMGYDTDITPLMGLRALLMGVAAAIVGGVGSMAGALLGGLLIGLAQHLGVWWLPTQWQDAIVFLILILFLFLRPQGFFGKPLKRVTV